MGDELPGAVGSDVALQMYGEVGVITFVCKEEEDTSGVIWSIIVGELGERKE